MAAPLSEQLKKRKKIIWLIIILLLLLIILGLVYFLVVYNKLGKQNINVNENLNQPTGMLPTNGLPASANTPNSAVLADLQGLNTGTPSVNENEQIDVQFLAKDFAERFGSYSNQSDYKNLDELDTLMTDSMKSWIAQYKEQLKLQNPSTGPYYAIETKHVSNQIQSLDEKAGTAEILIKTQRQEFKNSIDNSKILYQDILIKLIKVNDAWKVNGAYWQ